MRDKSMRLNDPAMLRALQDIPTMQRWEILRRTKRALTATELSAEAGATVEATQRSLDLLVAAKIATAVPANSRRRHFAYRASMVRLFLRWQRTDPSDAAAWRALEETMRNHSRRVQDDAAGRPGAEQFAPSNFGGSTSVLLLDEDALRVRESFRAAYAMLAEADQRARVAKGRNGVNPYHVSFKLQRLWEPELPMPEFFVIEETFHERDRRLLEAGVGTLLSPRELEVARMLEQGMSRPRIADMLGLKPNTIASMSKTIYRKLAVNNRAQLSARMRLA
jgi:DNA-binding CsgD family transcriptional regulator